jgi:hypothetical protein
MKWKRQHKTRCSQIPADVEQRSSQELLQEIEQILATSSSVDMDTDKLEAYLDILQERAPVMEDYDAKAEWEKTKAQHPLLFTPEPAKRPKKADARKWFKSVRAVEIAVAVALCLMITANAFGYNPIGRFLDWADGIVRVYSNPSGEMELPPDDPNEYHSLVEALEAYDIDPDSCPTWIPEDYALKVVTVRDSDGLLRISGTYRGDRGDLIIRATLHTENNYWANVLERDTGGSTCVIENKEFLIVTNANHAKIGWVQGNCFYEVNGLLTEDEINKMLKSIPL